MSPRGHIVRGEFAHNMHGVEGRLFNVIADGRPGLFANQQFKASREHSTRHRITIAIRWDDECRNGHNTLSICATIDEACGRYWRNVGGRQCVDEMRKHFPELAHMLPYHLCSSDGPLHYESNTVYLAGDRDCWGLRKGESRQIRNGRTGQLCWVMRGASAIYADGDAPPRDPLPVLSWQPLMRDGEGKARQLDAARAAAVWPEATDAELMQEPEALRAALRARLPGVLHRLRAVVQEAGFIWECP